MTNRRSILSSLCTGALALLAPVVAFAKPRYRKGRIVETFGLKPFVINAPPEEQSRCLSWSNAPGHTYALVPESDSNTYFWDGRELHALEPREEFAKRVEASLRALLAEARGVIAMDVQHAEEARFKIEGVGMDTAVPTAYCAELKRQLARIDAALKEKV